MRRLSACRVCLSVITGAFFGLSISLVPPAAAEDDKPGAPERSSDTANRIDFVRDVQPILRTRCYSCHGPEESESGLRLDQRKRAYEGGDNGRMIVPGKPAESRLLRIVTGKDDEIEAMPPEGEGTPLTTDEIALFQTWIAQGANWPTEADSTDRTSHWSYQPIRRPLPPTVEDSTWASSAIDAFILNRLEADGILPSPSAPRATLIRRLYFDLLGLPPTPAEVNTFVQDQRPDAYRQLVEGVLASPHYGERWGRHWLDLARYADSDGYEKDRPRPHAWRYRNWVIDSLNADMPFDRFSLLQLAGDMVPDASIEDRVASGFHRNTLHNTEGGTDKEEDRVKKTVDRTNTMGTIWLGLTVGCAQCHSHKYDPLTQREYYQLYSFFNSIDEKDIDAPLPRELAQYEQAKASYDKTHQPLMDKVAAYLKDQLPTAQAAWEATSPQSASVWRLVNPTSAVSKLGAELKKQDDLSLLATGPNVVADVYTIKAVVAGAAPVTGIRLEVLPDKSLVKNGPGRADNGNFVLTTFRLLARSADADEAEASVDVPLHAAKSDFAQKDWPIAAALNDKPDDGWAVSPQIGKRHVATFELKQPVQFEQGTQLTFVLDQQYTGKTHNLGKFRLSITTAASPHALEGFPSDVADVLAIVPAERTAEQAKLVTTYFKTVDSALAKLNEQLTQHAKSAPKKSAVKAQSVVQISKVRQANIHIRGDFLNKGDAVDSLPPAVLNPMRSRGEAPDRLDLAAWLFDRENPLMARVTVNRIWQRIFGRGIVETIDDFGLQSDPPSHPDLLDWLASEFHRQQFSIKQIQRTIVLSNTYRQSSATRHDLIEIDPENRLLARQTRRRVEAEVIRDMALAVSGLLVSQLGGPSVRPPQPTEYSGLTYANSAKWKVSQSGDAYRRGLYTFFQRTSPYPMLMTFDSPDSTECCAERSLSNTPLQALTLLNDPAFFECAQNLGRRVLIESSDFGDDEVGLKRRAILAIQICLARQPSEAELQDIVDLYRDQSTLLGEEETAAKHVVGKTKIPNNVSVNELAAWIIVSRTLMNLDEFITKE
jgi:hypothetical protein